MRPLTLSCPKTGKDQRKASLRSWKLDGERRVKSPLPEVSRASSQAVAGGDLGGARLIELAVYFHLFRDGFRQFGRGFDPLAPREIAAPQFGAQLLDMVVKRNHFVLSVYL